MTKQSYLCHVFRHSYPSYKEGWQQLKKGNLRSFLSNIIKRTAGYIYFCYLWYLPMHRHRLLKLMGSHASGIDHYTRDMMDLIKESMDLNSTAIIFPFKIERNHNFGKEVCHSSAEDYYNLSDSYYITAEGEKKKIKYIHAKDFLKIRNYYRILFFQQYETIHWAGGNKNIINVRLRDPEVEHLTKSTESPNIRFFEYSDRTQIHLCLADSLRKKAESVTATLGEYYLLQIRKPWDKHIPYNEEFMRKKITDWEIFHKYRAGRGIGRFQKEIIAFGNQQSCDILRDFTYGEGLRKQLLKIFPQGSNLYIMSNIWPPSDEDYFGPLRRSFKVYRYYDFQELAQLMEGEKCNTAQLKLIEKRLQDQSADNLILDFIRPIITSLYIQSHFN